MSCRRPLEAAQRPGSGEKPLVFKTGRRPKTLAEGFEALELPCGQCRSCRLEKSRIWAARLMHEAAYWEEFHGKYSIFLTLTYDDENLPFGGSLVKDDLQKFLKRLRWHSGAQFRYYGVGEYGTTCPDHEVVECSVCGPLQRPHFHVIVLGWTPFDKEMVGSREGISVYESKTIAKAWKKGFHEFGSCTFESCQYVSKYVMKKITGDEYKIADHYCRYLPKVDAWIDIEPEFAIMSRGARSGMKGIGYPWLLKYANDLYPSDELPIPGRGIIGKPPKYYDNLYEKEFAGDLVRIKEARREAMARSLVEGPSLESRARCEDAILSLYTRNL